MRRLVITLDMPDSAEGLDPTKFLAALGMQAPGRFGWTHATAYWACTTTNRAEAMGDAVSDHLCEHELHAHHATLPAVGSQAGADIVDRLAAQGWHLWPQPPPQEPTP